MKTWTTEELKVLIKQYQDGIKSDKRLESVYKEIRISLPNRTRHAIVAKVDELRQRGVLPETVRGWTEKEERELIKQYQEGFKEGRNLESIYEEASKRLPNRTLHAIISKASELRQKGLLPSFYRKLSEKERLDIRELVLEGRSLKEISKIKGINYSTLCSWHREYLLKMAL